MIIGVFLGALLWLLFELNKGLKKPDFEYSIFIRINAIPFITNLACALTLLWAREDIQEYFVITKFSSVILGLSGQGIFKKLYGIFDKKTETHIGINKSSS